MPERMGWSSPYFGAIRITVEFVNGLIGLLKGELLNVLPLLECIRQHSASQRSNTVISNSGNSRVP